MTVEVIAIGGYEEVGKNMTAVKVGEYGYPLRQNKHSRRYRY